MKTLENEKLLVEISEHGAEVTRIFRKDTKEEMLWNADPAFWGRHAPILFPFVGASHKGVYHYQGKEYVMKQHGFARDTDFEVIFADDTKAVYELKSNEKTKESYPFDFCLTVTYVLKENVLTVGWNVENCTDGEMYFTIGAHPAFNVEPGSCLVAEEGGLESLDFIRIGESGTALPEVYKLKLPGGRLRMPEDMFAEGVYIFENGQLNSVGLEGPDGKPRITVKCPGFPYVGVWSKPGAGFVCLEPWYGRTDDTGYTGDLSEKTGVQKLEKGKCFEASYDIVIG